MPERLRNIIRKWLWPLMPSWPDEGRRIVQGPHLKALLGTAVLEPRPFPCVFNAGSGEGGYSPLLLGLPGVELAVESDYGWRSSRATQIDRRQIFFCSSLTSIPVASQSFDLILCTEVLEHIAEHHQALDEIARVIKPDGWLLITVPTPPAIPDPNHVREGYRLEELGGMLAERDFEVVASRKCMHFFFRALLKNWPVWSRRPWCPSIVTRSLAYLDRLFPIGPPMDLMILARMAPQPSPRRNRRTSVEEQSIQTVGPEAVEFSQHQRSHPL